MTPAQKDTLRRWSPWLGTVLIPFAVWAFAKYDATNVSSAVYRADQAAEERHHATDSVTLHYEFREIRTRLDKLCTAVKC